MAEPSCLKENSIDRTTPDAEPLGDLRRSDTLSSRRAFRQGPFVRDPRAPLVRSCSKPHLPGHVRVQLDTVRQRFGVLGPERVYWPDEVAVDILKLCNGERTIVEIAAQLAEDYAAPVETIQTDVMEFVQS